MFFALAIVSVILAIATFAAPIFIAAVSTRFFVGLLASIITVAGLTIVYAWWADLSIDLELLWLAVNLDGMDTTERMQNVAPENREYAEGLVFSPRRMGIGWPLKAAFALAITLPYSCLCFSGVQVFRRIWVKRKRAVA